MKEYYIYKDPFKNPVYQVTAESFDEALAKVREINPAYDAGSLVGKSLIDLYLQDKNAKQYIDIKKV